MCFSCHNSSFSEDIKVSAHVATSCSSCILFCTSSRGACRELIPVVCGLVSWKEQASLFWWLAENREAFPKADEVTRLRLCLCYGTKTSYLPGGVQLSSSCNCDLSVKTRPLSSWQIEAQRPDSLGYTSVALSAGPVGSLCAYNVIASDIWATALLFEPGFLIR